MSSTIYENQPIYCIIKSYLGGNSEPTGEGLKDEILKNAKFGVKEDKDLMLLYTEEFDLDNDVEKMTKSCVINKNTFKMVVTQFNNMIYNDESIDILKKTKWSDVSMYQCWEGTMIVVFYECDKWYVITRRCLNARESIWIKDISYGGLFADAMKGKFNFDELNKKYCYHFVLLHHRSRNIVSYDDKFGEEYKQIIHVLTTEKYTLNEVDYTINAQMVRPPKLKIKNLDHALKLLLELSENDKKNGCLSTEGFIAKIRTPTSLMFLKLQTPEYQKVSRYKPNNSNLAQMFLEMYQNDTLIDFAHYYTRYSTDIVSRINKSMHTLSDEMHGIYHATRNQAKPDLYDILTGSYRSALYALHGIFICKKHREIPRSYDEMKCPKTISVHDVYRYLKSIPIYHLRQIYFDRQQLMEKYPDLVGKNPDEEVKKTTANMKYFIDCPDTMIQTKLML